MQRRILDLLRRFEPRALLLALGVIAAVWAFLTVGGEMAEGETMALDTRLLLMLREAGDPTNPIGSRSFEEGVRDITALGGFTVLTLVTAVGALAFYFHRKHRHALVLIGTVVLAQVFSEGLKQLYGRPRPELVPHGSYVYSGSFPSGHSMLSAATYLTFAMLIASVETRRSTKALVFVLAISLMVTVGISRVYLGVHWPSDVLAGWAAGAAFAFMGWVALLGLKPRPKP
ncbi:phosphatase PAP2 family protein [Phenylobacterium sp.]|uniref:phosphatase PAP2 family protein n=1 Tax=Phenylobacterium sp. TaxID=1871053 RepID=UPI003983CB56